MDSPPYVDRFGLPCYPQPVVCDGVSMFAFVLAADERALQALCDQRLNAPMGQPGRFRVLAPVVTLTVTQMDAVRSESLPFANMGALSEKEAAFWIPIVDTTAGPGPQPLSFFQPLLLLDNPLALAAGREIYGFPKDPATITMPADPAGVDDFAVDALTVRTFEPGATVTRDTLIRVERPSTLLGRLEADAVAAFAALHLAVKGLGEIAADLHDAMRLLHGLEQHLMQTVLLKQMRDITDGRRACYQAVVANPMLVTRFDRLHLLDAHTVTLASTASHPLPQALGLQPSQPSLLAFWVRYDARLPNGHVVWQA